jgi:hypothetical protein
MENEFKKGLSVEIRVLREGVSVVLTLGVDDTALLVQGMPDEETTERLYQSCIPAVSHIAHQAVVELMSTHAEFQKALDKSRFGQFSAYMQSDEYKTKKYWDEQCLRLMARLELDPELGYTKLSNA